MSMVPTVTSPSLNDAEEFVPPELDILNAVDDGVSTADTDPIQEAQGS